MEEAFDPYKELQLSPEAEPEMVKSAFRTLAKKYHPDQYPEPEQKALAEEKMKKLNRAQKLLLSGSYVPPRVSTEPESEPEPSKVPTRPQNENTRSTAPPPPSSPSKPPIRTSIPWAPFLLAALLVCAFLVIPRLLGQNHLASAEELFRKGQHQQALESANLAIQQDPTLKAAYLLRAQIWEKLSQPKRAETDRANARGLPGPEPTETYSPEASPTGGSFTPPESQL